MSDTNHEHDARRRLVAAQDYAARVERERPHDHAAIARAKAHVRRLKALMFGAVLALALVGCSTTVVVERDPVIPRTTLEDLQRDRTVHHLPTFVPCTGRACP